MRLARMFCAALALLSAAVVADDFDQLRDAVARGDLSAAVPALQAAAEKDDPRALGLLATLYQQGRGFPHDSSKAFELYARAAELGDAEAQFNLGSMYLLGDGVKADEAWALTYYRQAAAQGHAGAARNLDELYRASGLAPAPLNSTPPTRPLPEEAARLHAEPAVAPVPPVNTEQLAPGMSTTANPPVPGAVARDITAQRATSLPSAQHSPFARAPAAKPTSPGPMPAPVAAPTVPSGPSADELRAIELARAAGVEVNLDGSAVTAQPAAVDLPRPISATPREAGQPAFTPSSATGDADTVENDEEGTAAYASAQRYLRGQGVAPEPTLGVQWLERAARAGHTQAKYELALHYLKGEGVEADEAMAITLLRDAAQAGHVQAEAKLKSLYASAGMQMPPLIRPQPAAATSQDVKRSSSATPAAEPLPAVQPAAANVAAASVPAEPAPDGNSATESSPSFERGERNATRGAMTGMMADAAAEEDQELHAATTSPAAGKSDTTANDANASLTDARIALDAQDFSRAASIFAALAERGDAEAQAHIGYMTYRGEGVSADKSRAVEWYRKSAAQGNRDAQYNLAVAYAFGEGVAQNDAEAMRWYHRAAEQGSAVAQYSLGVSYASGEGATRDDAQAVKWYRAAAGQAYADAQYNLGQMILAGRGVQASQSEALLWFKQAADNGSAAAQYHLGTMYSAGHGVERDLNAAMRWYKLAAAQGHSEARADLAALESNR